MVLLVTPLLACTTAGVACLRGVGDTRTGMWVMILVNAVNVTLSWSLVRGVGPIPRLGFAGIAIGTSTGEAVGGLAVLAILAVGRSGLRLRLAGVWPAWGEAWRILRVSLPAAGESLTNVFCQLWFLGLINRLGSTATAAHGVAIRCEALAFLTVTAFSIAAGTLTGQYLGAGRPDLAAKAVANGLGDRRGLAGHGGRLDLRRGRGDVRPLSGREAAERGRRGWCRCSGSWRSPCPSWPP